MPKVLLVDDDFRVRESLAKLLNLKGHEVVSAASGREALDTAANTEFDVVLLDVMMPDMNGVDVLVKLREIRQPAPPIILMSGAFDPDEDMGEDAPEPDGFLAKPFGLQKLTEEMDRVLIATREL